MFHLITQSLVVLMSLGLANSALATESKVAGTTINHEKLSGVISADLGETVTILDVGGKSNIASTAENEANFANILPNDAEKFNVSFKTSNEDETFNCQFVADKFLGLAWVYNCQSDDSTPLSQLEVPAADSKLSASNLKEISLSNIN